MTGLTTYSVPTFDRLFNDFWNENFSLQDLGYKSRNNYPKADVYFTENEAILEIAVPGLSKDDLKVEYADGMLTVSGEKMTEVTGQSHRKELHRSSFKRSWTLTEMHDVENITSALKNGILKLSVPLLRKENKVLNIEVKE